MKDDKLFIDMPDDITIKAEIETIISLGLREEKTFYSHLKNLYKQIGIRFLFKDLTELIFAIFLISSILFFPLMDSSFYENTKQGGIYAYLFTTSPLLYMILSLYSFFKAKQDKTYEIEMTCKYDMYQVVAFRMLIFSIICILFNLAFVYVVVAIYEQISFLRAFMISVTSLFLFSTIFLSVTFNISTGITKYFIMPGWLLFNFALWIFDKEFYIKLLAGISVYVYLAVTIVAIYVYINKLKRLSGFKSIQGVI